MLHLHRRVRGVSDVEREHVEAWVNPSAWDDPEAAEQAIEAILASGSTDEADWVRIAGGDEADIAAAAERDLDRGDSWQLGEAVDRFQEAEAALDAAREELHSMIRSEHRRGTSAYRLAQITGITERHIGRIVGGRR